MITRFAIFLISFLLLPTLQAKDPYLVKGETIEVPRYAIDNNSRCTVLNMGYASSVILNPETWTGKNRIIEQIDIVFTAYPRNKEAWITNYDLLLNERIRALQQLVPPSVNNPLIRWNFILQSACQSEEEAKNMFHGAVIRYRSKSAPVRKQEEGRQQVSEIEEVYNEIGTITYGLSPFSDSVVFKTFERNQWKKMLIISDWTGSMYPYGAQAVLWHRLHFEKKAVKYFMFFNDGNQKTDRQKRIGNTGGIFFCKPDSLEYLLKVMRVVAKRGSGGDIPENNIEALLKGIRLIRGFEELVMVADNDAPVRDMVLLERVNVPVKIVLCGTAPGKSIHPHYLEIARRTGGSIHTIEQDIRGLQDLKEGDRINISGVGYIVKKGKIQQDKKAHK